MDARNRSYRYSRRHFLKFAALAAGTGALVGGELGPFPIVQGIQYMELLADAGVVKLNP